MEPTEDCQPTKCGDLASSVQGEEQVSCSLKRHDTRNLLKHDPLKQHKLFDVHFQLPAVYNQETI